MSVRQRLQREPEENIRRSVRKTSDSTKDQADFQSAAQIDQMTSDPRQMLALQQKIGNQAVQRLIENRAPSGIVQPKFARGVHDPAIARDARRKGLNALNAGIPAEITALAEYITVRKVFTDPTGTITGYLIPLITASTGRDDANWVNYTVAGGAATLATYYDGAWADIGAVAPVIAAPVLTPHVYSVPPTGGRGITRVTDPERLLISQQMIAAFPYDQCSGQEGAGTLVYVNGAPVRRKAGGSVSIDINGLRGTQVNASYPNLRIDLQGSNAENGDSSIAPDGRQRRVTRFALQNGDLTYANINVEGGQDFGAAYLRAALLASLGNQENGHVYMI